MLKELDGDIMDDCSFEECDLLSSTQIPIVEKNPAHISRIE
jgi:hypothetical protein